MQILNLVNQKLSEIKFDISKFPDGQQQIKITGFESKSIWTWGHFLFDYPVQIKSRLNNFQDLELIICATKSLQNSGVKQIDLFVPYFLGSRSDRKFDTLSNNYLKDVICPIVNSLNFNSVTVVDPHSDVLEACVANFIRLENYDLVKYALTQIGSTNYVLMSPDAGAIKKIYKVAESIYYKGEIITCCKIRENGKIIKTEVPYIDLSQDVILIDDICDGGRTFIEIANAIKLRLERFEEINGAPGKLYLIITHGVFSKGYKELNKYFDGIFCTNSYKDIPEKEWDGDKKDIPTGIKQLNIF